MLQYLTGIAMKRNRIERDYIHALVSQRSQQRGPTRIVNVRFGRSF